MREGRDRLRWRSRGSCSDGFDEEGVLCAPAATLNYKVCRRGRLINCRWTCRNAGYRSVADPAEGAGIGA